MRLDSSPKSLVRQNTPYANSLSEAIGSDVILRVFGNVDLDQVTGFVEQSAALFTKMRQVQTFAVDFVLFRKPVDGLKP